MEISFDEVIDHFANSNKYVIILLKIKKEEKGLYNLNYNFYLCLYF